MSTVVAMRAIAFTAARCAGIALAISTCFIGVAAAQAPGHSSAFIAKDCDHACLVGFLHSYLDALTHKDRGRAHFAADVRFTENDVEMPLGNEGLWASISAVAASGLEVADTTTGNAAWFGTVEEYGQPAYYAMRLRIRDGQISEVETVVDRKGGLPAPFGDPSKLVHDPAFGEVLPPEQRRARERLIAVANGYFSTVELNDGQVLTEFDPDCQRTENGISTTRGSGGAAAIAQGCEAQFKLGIYRINKRVRERRYELVDEERGIVVGTGFFDHANTFDTYDHRRQGDEDGFEVAQLHHPDGGVQDPRREDLPRRGGIYVRPVCHAFAMVRPACPTLTRGTPFVRYAAASWSPM